MAVKMTKEQAKKLAKDINTLWKKDPLYLKKK